MADAAVQEVRAELEALRRQLAERKASLPAHSLRPHQVIAVEDLEERIATLERQLRGGDPSSGGKAM